MVLCRSGKTTEGQAIVDKILSSRVVDTANGPKIEYEVLWGHDFGLGCEGTSEWIPPTHVSVQLAVEYLTASQQQGTSPPLHDAKLLIGSVVRQVKCTADTDIYT